MARVKNYVNDTSLSNDDRLFGTDGAGGINTNANFTLGDLKEFINTGVDIVAKTPKFHIPVINETSDDATAAGIRVEMGEATANVHYYAVDPDPDTPSDNKQVAKGVFRLINDGSGWLLEVTNYTGAYHLDSFVGKSFSILAGPGEGVRVTGTLGAYLETDEKDYVIDEDGDVVHSLRITRTGDLQTSWALLTSARTFVTELQFFTIDNPVMPNRVTVIIDGDIEMGNAFIEELTALKIILPEGGDGLTFGDEDSDNYFNMNADADGNMVFTGFGDSTLIVDAPVDLRKTLNVEGETNFNDHIVVAEAKSLTFQSDNLIADDSALVLSHEGIKHTLHDSTERVITPVDANDSIDTPTEQGVLTSLQIGTERYTVPTSISQVAQTLPGLYEGLSPVPGDVITESIRRHNAGRYNETIVSNAAAGTTFTTWVADIGHFSLYAADTSMELLDDAIRSTGSETATPVLSPAQQANVNFISAVTPNEDSKVDFGGLLVGDEFRVHTNEENFIQYAVTSIDSRTFQESGQDRTFYLYGVDTFTAADAPFTFNENTDYQISAINTFVNVDITTGEWFYGIDNGTNVEFKSTLATQPTAIDFAIGDTGDAALPPDTALQTADAGIPNGQRLFFVDNTNDISALVDGDTVPGNAYEVVAYIHDNPLDDFATITFSRIGDGNLHISSPNLTISNIPEATGIIQNFLVLDDDDRVNFRQLDEIAGVQAQVNYEDSINPGDNGVLQGISFVTGSNNHNLDTNGGNLTVDVSGKIPVEGTTLNGDTDVEDWRAYVLGDPGPEGATLRLPATADLESGATIRLYNLSDIDPDGESVIPDGIWSVTTDLPSERIMRDLDDLELDEITTVDLVWTGNPNDGWIIR